MNDDAPKVVRELSSELAKGASDETFVEEGVKLLDAAEKDSVLLRIMGSIAFKLHCPQFAYLNEQMNRKLTDIDLASYSAETNRVDKLLRGLGYTTQSYVQIAVAAMSRSIYWNKETSVHVDVFWDKLVMNHVVNFRGRLEKDHPTIPLPELLQEKFQIVKINWKDIKDVIILLREHDISENDGGREVIDMSVITKVLSNDWGYYYTFTQNIKETQKRLDELTMLNDADKSMVSGRLARMLQLIEDTPKGTKWKLRGKIGTKRTWYTEVGEV
jgi:hypothetical protein